jgi:hypothetical protein
MYGQQKSTLEKDVILDGYLECLASQSTNENYFYWKNSVLRLRLQTILNSI